ncbi:MAG TPA: hypothetical protein VEF35_10575 [Candidatus Bathyarchaeia archaeon]|nr:hypothetical protein [Candidatus Bathyarchaeia archaeon]
MRSRRGTKIVGVIHKERDDAELELLGGSQITGITYLEKESDEVKLLSASKFDLDFLRDATATGVLYRDQTAADVQLLPGSKIAGVLYEEAKAPELKLLRVAHTALKLVSGQAVKGLLYQQQGGAEIKLLNDVSDLSAAAGALLIGVLHQETQTGALRLVSGQAVKGLLYQQQGGAEIKLLNDLSDLSAAAGTQAVGILYRNEVPSQ